MSVNLRIYSHSLEYGQRVMSHGCARKDTNANKCIRHRMVTDRQHFQISRRLCLLPTCQTVPVCSNPFSLALVERAESFPAVFFPGCGRWLTLFSFHLSSFTKSSFFDVRKLN